MGRKLLELHMSMLTRHGILVTGITVLYVFPIAVQAQSEYNTPQAKLNARAFNVVRVVFPTEGRVAGIGVSFSRDGELFESTNAGLPRPGRLFTSSATMDGTTTVLLAIVGSFQMGKSSFFFDSPGLYYFKWEIRYEDRTIPFRTIVQNIEVSNAVSADLDFIFGLADPALMRAMFGEDFFERQTGNAVKQYADPEVRAVKVIGRLLYATRENWVGDSMREAGPRGDIHNAAEILLSLAKRFPESSYTPYAAYYAGCCYYALCIEEAEEAIRRKNKQGGLDNDLALGKYRVAQLMQNPDTTKAYQAFTIAAQRADDYLKPRVLYQHGTLRLFSSDFDEAERLIMKAAQVVHGEIVLQKWFDKKFGGIEQLHTNIEKAKVRFQCGEDAASAAPKP